MDIFAVTRSRATGGVCPLIRQVLGIHRLSNYGALLHYSRDVFGFLGILLLGVLVLSTASRRPYLNLANPAAHPSKTRAITQTQQQQDVAPRVQPSRVSSNLVVPARTKPFFPTYEIVSQGSRGILPVLALRSPPIV